MYEDFDRRAFLKVGSLSLFGIMGYGDILRLRAQSPAPAKRDLSVIHLLLSGGISQVDSWDPKPDADSKYRSQFKPIETNVSGIRISEHLALTAKHADKFVIIRSMTHKLVSHESALALICSGHEPLGTIQFPAMQTVVSKELGPRTDLPPAVSIPIVTGSWEKSGFLSTKYNPFNAGNPNVSNYKVRDLDLPMGVDWARMDRRRSLLAVVDEEFRRMDTTGISESMDSYYQTAFTLMHSAQAKKAFQIENEPESMRDRYGRTSLGQGALLARRLVEAGVRFVTVSRGFNTFDHHKNIFPLLQNVFLPELDRAYSALLEDLGQRGMLDSTVVIVTGEFGRTPEINAGGGRDHWPNAFSLTISGGGITGGRVYGATDEKGGFVKDNPVQVADLAATLYRKLGIDPDKEYISNIGRPVKIGNNGKPMDFLMV
ncbi:MAG TPA: DUF1501 domain-containing protein [Bryobacteraceae bacterium]|nr:DUF1501 domain-containing protein [Bryobacteraceae bacterium]